MNLAAEGGPQELSNHQRVDAAISLAHLLAPDLEPHPEAVLVRSRVVLLPEQVAGEELAEFLGGEERNPQEARDGDHEIEHRPLDICWRLRVQMVEHDVPVGQHGAGAHILHVEQIEAPPGLPVSRFPVAEVMPDARERGAREKLQDDPEPARQDIEVQGREADEDVDGEEARGRDVESLVGRADLPLHLWGEQLLPQLAHEWLVPVVGRHIAARIEVRRQDESRGVHVLREDLSGLLVVKVCHVHLVLLQDGGEPLRIRMIGVDGGGYVALVGHCEESWATRVDVLPFAEIIHFPINVIVVGVWSFPLALGALALSLVAALALVGHASPDVGAQGASAPGSQLLG
mmetsp:Transcript_103049/g.291860  ORF Transcript_103049/g.291860 Transcript_103049/m.291860 type:complete len:346 (-) Transcript_103049:14-1051(-)